jgi:hypothetical protein
MGIPLTIRAWLTAIISGCIACIAVAGLASLTEAYIVTERSDRAEDPSRAYGFNGYSAHVVIQSLDTSSHTLTAAVSSPSLGDPVLTQLTVSPDIKVERQDAIMENGTFIGVRSKTQATLDELKSGTRGIAFLRIDEKGAITIRYLLIGDPFPRP